MNRYVAMALVCLSGSALAEDMSVTSPDTGHNIGVGIGFSGTPGISVYDELRTDRFLQGSVSFADHGSFAVTGDYAFSYPNAIRGVSALTPFWGLGAVVLHEQDNYWVRHTIDEEINPTNYVGGRIPLGVNFVIPKTPIQLSAQVAPTILFTPATYTYLEGALDVRVLF